MGGAASLRAVKTYSMGLLVVLGGCGLAVACTGDDDAVSPATGDAAGHGSTGAVATGGGGTSGADQGAVGANGGTGDAGNAGSGEGGDGEEAARQARCRAVCSIVPTGDLFGVAATGEPCGHYDECVEGLCDLTGVHHQSECRIATDALLPCLLALTADKFYCENQWLGIDYAGYYFCNDAYLTRNLVCMAP